MGLREAQDLPKVTKHPASTVSPVLACLLILWDVCSFMIHVLAPFTFLASACYSSAQALRRPSGFLTGTGANEENMPRITILQRTAFPEPTFYIPASPLPWMSVASTPFQRVLGPQIQSVQLTLSERLLCDSFF